MGGLVHLTTAGPLITLGPGHVPRRGRGGFPAFHPSVRHSFWWGWQGRQAGSFREIHGCRRAQSGWEMPEHQPGLAPDAWQLWNHAGCRGARPRHPLPILLAGFPKGLPHITV